MQIFVDADACPVVGIVEKVAKEHAILCKRAAVFLTRVIPSMCCFCFSNYEWSRARINEYKRSYLSA